jgi:hypothetical protein
MALYVVQAAGSDVARLQDARFVKDGFSRPAFIFAQFWLLYHRLWVALIVWIAAEVAFFLLVFPHIDGAAAAAIDLLARLFLGLEGGRLRLRRDAAVTDLVEARDLGEAESIFFHRHLDAAAARPVQA